uniref:Uncharacterized protein n=1 Tax=Mycena chlorophos TaxID=658473 RepID=A0ABQ0MAJ8_MYCCL|nr:predicted protein [Mycena chlorophos]
MPAACLTLATGFHEKGIKAGQARMPCSIDIDLSALMAQPPALQLFKSLIPPSLFENPSRTLNDGALSLTTGPGLIPRFAGTINFLGAPWDAQGHAYNADAAPRLQCIPMRQTTLHTSERATTKPPTSVREMDQVERLQYVKFSETLWDNLKEYTHVERPMGRRAVMGTTPRPGNDSTDESKDVPGVMVGNPNRVDTGSLHNATWPFPPVHQRIIALGELASWYISHIFNLEGQEVLPNQHPTRSIPVNSENSVQDASLQQILYPLNLLSQVSEPLTSRSHLN